MENLNNGSNFDISTGQGFYDNNTRFYGGGGPQGPPPPMYHQDAARMASVAVPAGAGGPPPQFYQDTTPTRATASNVVYQQPYAPVNEPIMDPAAVASSFYPQQQPYEYVSQGWDQQTVESPQRWNPLEQHQQQQQQQQHHHLSAEEATPPGSYFMTTELTPRVFGYAISALAFDLSYSAMYVASTTQSMSTTRWRSHRASMLVTHSTTDGMLYSSCGGHPEASASALQAVYECMYGISRTVPLPPGRQHVPSHAYRPPYGGCNVEASSITMLPGGARGTTKQQGHLGINSLLPLSGYVASVSPSAVRIHSRGGLQIHDQSIEGMICGTMHPLSSQDMPTHISVGGVPHGRSKHNKHEVHCLDLWQGLRIVSSRAFKDTYNSKVGVTAMATSHERGSIVAGCSDGNIRLLDGSLRELATVKGHTGGVSSIAVSDDGILIATTGHGSRLSGHETSNLYSFPDPNVFVYDIRYLGRGGMPHPFADMRGAPTFLSFLPEIQGLPSNRLLVGSGQPGGGLQIMVPFESQNEMPTSFLLPQLERGESISAMVQSEEELALGTSAGRVLQYRMAGYNGNGNNKTKPASGVKSAGIFVPSDARSASSGGGTLTSSLAPRQRRSGSHEKQPLEILPFVPSVPAVTLDPNLLQSNDPNIRNGTNDRVRSLFSTYTLRVHPKLTTIGTSAEEAMATFGSIACQPIVASTKRTVAPSLINEVSPDDGDFLLTIPTSKLEIDLLANHKTVNNNRLLGRKASITVPNPNKLLYTSSLSSICYEHGLNRRRRSTRGQRSSSGSAGDFSDQEVPSRYRLKLRPNYKASGAFDPAEFNDTGLFPGWDYPPTMPNAFAAPVMLLLYFVPEVRVAVLNAQYNEKLFSAKAYEKALAPELGFVFHQIESLSRFGLLYSAKQLADKIDSNNKLSDASLNARIGAWVPSNFLTALSTMPEAEQLQILDGSPAAVDPPRRPEAFYRFLAYHLDKELCTGSNRSSEKSTKLMDSLHGIDFVSVNQFITGSGPSSHSSQRALTVDLAYEAFSSLTREQPQEEKKASHVRFGEVLQHALCRETRLRAWNQTSKAYETIVQRKIATCLPKLLTLSCACAGRKEEDGLWAWRAEDGSSDSGQWLPEMVEVELEADGNVVVRELVKISDDGQESWITFQGKSSIPESVSKIVVSASNRSNASGNKTKSTQKYRYRLDAVLSFVRDDSCSPEMTSSEEHPGHHILHARIPKQYKRRATKQQQDEASKMASRKVDPSKLVLTANTPPEIFRLRSEQAGASLAALKKKKQPTNSPRWKDDDDWVLFNGFVVSNTVVEDARAFHVAFKEPCLVVFRAVDADEQKVQRSNSDDDNNNHNRASNNSQQQQNIVCRIPPQVLNARSLSNNSVNNGNKTTPVSRGQNSNNSSSDSNNCNPMGLSESSLIAFDAEFVAVQEEEATLTETGSKVILRETRHALARISVLDCKNRTVLLDDHVLPRERVVDYLTRFSGIVAQDLDPATTTHALTSTRSAYLKLRFLMEQGCIFVGHGLRQDFATVNLIVPPYQILDTVELFHQPGMRYISLRFLANHVLGRDMQQDTHDSVEDARAAFELFEKALEWKRNNVFDKKLQELYAYGQKTDWKLGVENVS